LDRGVDVFGARVGEGADEVILICGVSVLPRPAGLRGDPLAGDKVLDVCSHDANLTNPP
jgi:hypothetical protein